MTEEINLGNRTVTIDDDEEAVLLTLPQELADELRTRRKRRLEGRADELENVGWQKQSEKVAELAEQVGKDDLSDVVVEILKEHVDN